MSVLAVGPSRGRPKQAAEVVESFHDTALDPGSRLLFLVDADDPTLPDYPRGYVEVVEPTGCMGGALAQLSQEMVGGATSIGMIGDDNRFRTPGWDVILDGWLSSTPGIAYPDDGFQHERLPTNWWLSRPIFDEFGLAHPYLRHLYMDNYWQAMGEGARCLRYFPEVLIEHLHPLAGKGVDDPGYHRGGGMGVESPNITHDRGFFEWWSNHQRGFDVRELRRLIDYRRHAGNVLADFHHPALFESLAMLFEDRFGWNLYRPVGMPWKDASYWTFNNPEMRLSPNEFLLVGQPLERGEDGIVKIENPQYPSRPMKGVTLPRARAMDWDFVIASVWQNQLGFSRFAAEQGAQFIHQIGNAANAVDWNLPAKYLISARLDGHDRPHVVYHQEFSLDLFKPAETRIPDPTLVVNFSARFNFAKGAYRIWEEAQQLAPEFRWQDHGSMHGDIVNMADVALAMRQSTFIWHDKPIGDGYGHVIHNAAAIGRPIIGHSSYYRGRLAEPFWRDGETCIDLDKHSLPEAIEIMRDLVGHPDRYAAMCDAMYETFRATVDFDADAERIKALLS